MFTEHAEYVAKFVAEFIVELVTEFEEAVAKFYWIERFNEITKEDNKKTIKG